MSQPTQFENADLRNQLRAALIHQARQPLFALQNYLAATSHVADRMNADSDVQLIRKCLTQMQNSIEKLSATLSDIAEFDIEDESTLLPMNLVDFLNETFQISGFVARQQGLRIQWETHCQNNEMIQIPRRATQLALIRWILTTCGSDEFPAETDDPIKFTAEQIGTATRFSATSKFHSATAFLSDFTSLSQASHAEF